MTLFVLLLVLLLAVVSGAYYCYRITFSVPRAATLDAFEPPVGEQYEPIQDKILNSIKIAAALPYQDVYITSHDGYKLRARYYEAAPGAPVQIMFHGYRSNPLRDFSGGLPLALKTGCNVLLVDQRAHGESEGRCLSFGVLERYDALAWANYAVENFGDVPIVLVGLSMGAGTVMMASDLPLPANVVGIVADCGYTTAGDIIRKVMADVGYPQWLYPMVRLGSLLFGRFDIDATSPQQALANTNIPVLLIHGDDDRFVPCDMSRKNYEVCSSEKQLVTIPGAGHGLAYMIGPEEYRAAVQAFVRRVAKMQ